MDLARLVMAAVTTLGIALLYMAVWWFVSVISGRVDVVDLAWGPGFAVIGWAGAVLLAPVSFLPRPTIAAVLVTVWGVRLSAHIFARGFRRGRIEDPRYAELRAADVGWWLNSLPKVFLLQGAFMWVISAPLIVLAASAARPLGWFDAIAIAVWAAGFLIETAADAQLRWWLSDDGHRGHPLEVGLWAWSRHPNYFGDALMWWGIGLLALSAPLGFVGLVGPLAMTLLLRFVTGVPPLERRHLDDPAWQAYRAHTPVFLPRPPKR